MGKKLFKLIVIGLLNAAALALGLVGCGDDDSGGSNSTDSATIGSGGTDVDDSGGSNSTDSATVDSGGTDVDTCNQIAAYGPQPCQSNTDCTSDNGGPGWYCDTDNAIKIPGCPDMIWPMCLPPTTDTTTADTGSADTATADTGSVDTSTIAGDTATCNEMTFYGPPPCQSDTDCTDQGAGWYCDTDNTIAMPDGCPPLAMPICTAPGTDTVPSPTDVAYYGPQYIGCTSDQECIDDNSAGWYCDDEGTAPSYDCVAPVKAAK